MRCTSNHCRSRRRLKPCRDPLIRAAISVLKGGATSPYLFNATAILMLRQFFLHIPQSLIDAARMDGMSELRILFTIFWPLSKPVLSIVAIFTFMGSWNEVLWPLLVVRDQQLMTLPQLLTVFALGGGAGSVGVSLASAMVLVVPVVIAYMFLQRNFTESMAGAGIKG
jgi:multiple sugar transport system permease protein